MGALYLLYIAWTTWRGAKILIKGLPRPRAYAFRDGLFTNLSNPKSVLFAVAVLIVIFPPDVIMLKNRFVLIKHFLIEALLYGILAFVMSTEAVSKAYLRKKVFLGGFAAVVLGALGLRLLFQR